MELIDKLNKLDQVLLEKHPRLLANLLPPLKDSAQMSLLLSEEVQGFVFPNDIIELYSWKSGTNVKKIKMEDYDEINSDSFIIPSWYLMDFNDAINHFKNKKNDVFKFKNEYYFPFLYTGFGHYLTVKLIAEKSKKNEKEFEGVYLATTPRKKIYGNYLFYRDMSVFLESTIECYTNGAYYEYPNGVLAYDVLKESEICYELTPNSSHWHLKKFGTIL